MRLVAFGLASTVVLSLAACSEGDVLDGDIAAVTIYGTVTTAASEPVPGAVLRFWGFWTAAEGPPMATDTADASGSFGQILWNWGTRSVIDLQIVVDPPDGSGLRPDTTSREDVVLTGSDVPDSIRIDFALQPTP